MSLKPEDVDAIEDLSTFQVKALERLLEHIERYMGDEVLKCSLGRGDAEAERRLVAAKHQHEGSIKAALMLKKEIQRYRKSADDRRPA